MTPSFVLTLGMLSIPVKSYPASRTVTTKFSQLHGKCGAPVESLGRKCSSCGKAVPNEEVVKGYNTGTAFVQVSKPDLEMLEAAASKAMEIQAFVPQGDIDPVVLEKANHLGPVDPATAKAFCLLREAMKKTERAAIVQYVASSRERIGLLRATDDTMVLHELFYPNEVRAYAEQKWGGPVHVALNPKEVDLCVQLIRASEDRFDLSGYEDRYQKRMMELIQARMDGAEPTPLTPSKPPAPVVDLMEALKASLATKKAAHEAHGVAVKKGPVKRAKAS
jgi:DNA end-binding protein Ku